MMLTNLLSATALVLLAVVGANAQPIGSWSLYDDGEDNYIARHECSFVQAGDKFYFFGGRENATVIDVFDIPSNSWNPNGIAYLPEAAHEYNHFQAVEHEGLLWIIFGFEDNANPFETDATNIAVFDPANEVWMEGPTLPVARVRGGGGTVVHNGVFYSVGGNNNGHRGGYQPWLDHWNPRTNSFVSLADAPIGRDHFHAVLCAGKLWAAGGRQSGHPDLGAFRATIPQVDYYDFDTKGWSTLPESQDLASPRAGTTTVCYEDRWLVVIGGEGNNRLKAWNSTEALDVVAALNGESVVWESMGLLNYARHGTQAILSGDSIFVAGGSPKQGGGNIHLMERWGGGDPVGTAMAAGELLEHRVKVDKAVVKNTPADPNVQGVYVTDIQFTGDYILGNYKGGRPFRLPMLIPNGKFVPIPVIWLGGTTGTSGKIQVIHSGGKVLEMDLLDVTGVQAAFVDAGENDSVPDVTLSGTTVSGTVTGQSAPYDTYREGTTTSHGFTYVFRGLPAKQYYTLKLSWHPLDGCVAGSVRQQNVFVQGRCYDKYIDVYEQGCSTTITKVYGAYANNSGNLSVMIKGYGGAKPYISAIELVEVTTVR